jgi:hypothetical protein
VDGIEKDLAGRARVVRVSLGSPAGRELRQRHGISGIPTLFVFDGRGELVHRDTGRPQREAIVARVLEGSPAGREG